MRKRLFGLVILLSLAACALQPSPEYWDALGNAKLENARARTLLDAQQYDQALVSIERAATIDEFDRTTEHQNYLRLEALSSMGNVGEATNVFTELTAADSDDAMLFELGLEASQNGSISRAIGAAQVLVLEIWKVPPTQEEAEAQFKETLPEEFTSVFGGGDFSVYLPPARRDNPQLHKNLAASQVLALTVLRQNPGSEEAIEFLLKTPGSIFEAIKLRGLNTVEEQIASGAFTDDGLSFAKQFVRSQYVDIQAWKKSHESYCVNYARFRPCKQKLDYWWYPDGR